jgi:basic amino acid/polyamine antiporter, APA family
VNEATPRESNPELTDSPRVIGGLGSFALVAGSMLGIGIFIVPPVVAGYITSPLAFLGIWLVAGFLAFAGAVACAELGSLLPRAGGDYVFQTKAYGRSVAFASGWVLFAAIFAGSIATMSVALCQFQLPVLGLDYTQTSVTLPLFGEVKGMNLVALAIVVLLTAINSVGALVSARVQTVLLAVPMTLLTAGAVYAIAAGPSVTVSEWVASTEALLHWGTVAPVAAEASAVLSMSNLIEAYVAVYFAYSGWNAVTYVAGEIKNPDRNIPFSLLTGTVVVTLVYILLCVAFLVVLGISGLQGAGEAGTFSAGILGGPVGQVIVTVLIAMALFAGLNGTVMGGARVAFAMGRGGAFLAAVGKLSPRTKAPVRALWLQAFWACILILTGSFAELLTLTSLAMLVTGTLTVSSVFILRRTMPDARRPYKAFGYPWLPTLYIIASLTVIGYKVVEAFSAKPDSWYPLLGLGVLAVAFTVHQGWLLWAKKKSRRILVGTIVFFVGAGLLVSQTARGASLTLYQELEAGSAAAVDSPESESLRTLYATVTCTHGPNRLKAAGEAAYCETLEERVAYYSTRFKDVAGPWIANKRPKGLPETVLYPFSGADLVSSVLAFPDARLHIHLSLEHGGPVDALGKLSEAKRGEALKSLQRASAGLLKLGDSRTKDLRLAHLTQLPGKLPIALTGLAAHGATVVSVRYFQVKEDGSLDYFKPEEMANRRTKGGHTTAFDGRWSNVELAFRLPGDERLRFMQHVAVNLSNRGLAEGTGKHVKTWIESLGKVSFMTKAATYLLWGSNFKTIRELAKKQSVWMLTDASGILPSDLPDERWTVTPYGTFACDFLNVRKEGPTWQRRNDDLARFFKDHSREELSFRFGYVDCMNKPSVMIAARK